MSELVEQVARAIAPVALPYIEGYEEVPPDHIWTRPRYQWLGFAMTKIANAALSVLEPRIEALEAENFKLAAGACNVEGGLIGDDHGHFDCSLKARIEALERELAEAVAAERERCARIAERASEARAFEATLSDDRAFVGARLEAADIAAAIRSGDAV